MKRFIAILMAAIMLVAMASVASADEVAPIYLDFENDDLNPFYTGGFAIPEITEEKGNKFIRMIATPEDVADNPKIVDESTGAYVSGGVDGHLDIQIHPVDDYGNEFVFECKFRMMKQEWEYADGQKLFQIQPKSNEGWTGNYSPCRVVIDKGEPKLTGIDADKAYKFKWDTWYDVAICWDFADGTITGYVNGIKAYTTTVNRNDSNITGYQFMMFGMPDKVECPFCIDMDDINIFSGTAPKYQATGDDDLEETDVVTGDITAVVALVAVLACGTGIVASKKH